MNLVAKLSVSICILLLTAACNRPFPKHAKKSRFTIETIIKTTPVKNQANSDLCWVYAMLATIESEHIMIGDSINLSTDYIARMMLQDEAVRYYLSHGSITVSLKGMPPMLMRLMAKFGAMPYDSYNAENDVNYNVLCRKLMMIAGKQNNIAALNAKINDEIDRNVGYLPKNIYMYGAQYTPLEFAHSIYRPDEYVSLTSFTHHPFNQKFALEVPDNKLYDEFLNIPIDTLMARMEDALRSGHPVCWEGDVSEHGFSFADGVAILPENTPVTQQERQHEFDILHTTDDHCMELIGIAHDEMGEKYIISKNSWGTDNPYKGLMYLSEDYIKLKTIAVYMSRKTFNSTSND